ncbi:unnamed protein product [Pleuronectes platessa]|uniref:Uncharacterized protein n=1 Tax=Pleuronectes platessa TaxID=8262 RepID=A0A9N7VHI5_PLEPL|nr:unnamed protein product [Pleuronectes platessa]
MPSPDAALLSTPPQNICETPLLSVGLSPPRLLASLLPRLLASSPPCLSHGGFPVVSAVHASRWSRCFLLSWKKDVFLLDQEQQMVRTAAGSREKASRVLSGSAQSGGVGSAPCGAERQGARRVPVTTRLSVSAAPLLFLRLD